jgi:hypothetical protein
MITVLKLASVWSKKTWNDQNKNSKSRRDKVWAVPGHWAGATSDLMRSSTRVGRVQAMRLAWGVCLQHAVCLLRRRACGMYPRGRVRHASKRECMVCLRGACGGLTRSIRHVAPINRPNSHINVDDNAYNSTIDASAKSCGCVVSCCGVVLS